MRYPAPIKRAISLLAAMLWFAPPLRARQPDEQLLVFTELTPLAGNTELSRRLLTPLAVVEMQKGI